MSFITRNDSAEAPTMLPSSLTCGDHRQIYLRRKNRITIWLNPAGSCLRQRAREIGYAPVSLSEFADIYRAEGDGDELASMYHAAAMGLMDAVTDDFQHITGHEPMPMDRSAAKLSALIDAA